MALGSSAHAGETLAIFPIEMTMPTSEEDFFRGTTGPSPDEKRRLALAEADLKQRLGADGRYEIVDLAPLAEEIAQARPIQDCNGCEVGLATKAKAAVALTSVVHKISETHLSLTVVMIDVAQRKLLSTSNVLIQGNTDDSWLHGVRWLVRNRLLAKDEPK